MRCRKVELLSRSRGAAACVPSQASASTCSSETLPSTSKSVNGRMSVKALTTLGVMSLLDTPTAQICDHCCSSCTSSLESSVAEVAVLFRFFSSLVIERATLNSFARTGLFEEGDSCVHGATGGVSCLRSSRAGLVFSRLSCPRRMKARISCEGVLRLK